MRKAVLIAAALAAGWSGASAVAQTLPYATALQVALESHVSGASMHWQDSMTQAGTVTPISTYKSKAGLWCRTFKVRAISTTAIEQTGTACRVDGRWVIAQNP